MVTLPRAVRWALVAGVMVVVAWIRLSPAALDVVERQAERRVRQAVAERLAAEKSAEPDPAAARAWIAAHPAEFRREVAETTARLRDELRYEGADGRSYTYLADYDSYLWLRHARNYLRHGTTCDAVVDGECRDTLTIAPVGAPMRYARSLHIVAIVALHRAITLVAPDHPLPATAFLVPVILGTLGVLPAFGIGRLLAGDLGGIAAAVLVSVNPMFLVRSFGADNDVWNVVLPLCLVWALMRALVAAGTVSRVAWSLAAAVGATLHAATWSGWVFTHLVTIAGLAAIVVQRGLAAGLARRPVEAPAGAVLVLTVYGVGAAAGVALAVSGEAYLALARRVAERAGNAWGTAPAAGSPTGVPWPDAFAGVAELTEPSWLAFTTTLGGPLLVFTAWLGLLVMFLPVARWRPWHFAVLIAGNFLYLHLLTTPGTGRWTLVALLAAPLLVSVALALTLDRERPAGDPSRDGRTLVAAWFLAALVPASETARFILLLVAPFGIAVGVALGRLGAALRDLAARVGDRAAHATVAVLPVALFVALAPWIANAHRQIGLRLPEIDDAWWDTLRTLRADTPADAIVFAWWDYGHWIKYGAERRVAIDGANLLTHVSHWLGRALAAADERETLGLLRMLACGSDATPQPEGRQGAFGMLRALGRSDAEAYGLVVDLAVRDRAGARDLLRDAGLAPSQQADVLAATHCAPPPARLLVTRAMARQSSWFRLARWDPRRGPDAADDTGRPMFLVPRWIPCVPEAATSRYTCPLPSDATLPGIRRSFEYPAGDPSAGRLAVRPVEGADGPTVARAPAVVIAVTDEGREETVPADAARLEVGALVDPAGPRVLLGRPDVLRSTFTALLFLDGRPLTRFVERDRRESARGQLVTTWEVVWSPRRRSCGTALDARRPRRDPGDDASRRRTPAMVPELTLGGWTVTSYLAVRLAFVVTGGLLAVHLNRRLGIGPRDTLGALAVGVPAGLLGAHVLSLLERGGYDPGDPGLLYFWRDHSAIFGGFLGGALAAAGYTRWRGLSLPRLLDGGAPVMALGEGMTRLGCFAAGCCHGRPTGSWLGMRFPHESQVFRTQLEQAWLGDPTAASSVPVHPTQLYAAAFGFALCALLVAVLPRRSYDGQAFCLFLFTYGAWRFLLFYLRADPGPMVVAGLYPSQLAALGAIAAAVVLERRWRGRAAR